MAIQRAFRLIQRLNSKAPYRPLTDLEEKAKAEARETIEAFIDALPSGSGFDSPPHIAEAGPTAITLNVPFHTLNDVGYYVGWVNYKVRIYPKFDGLNIDVTIGDNFENVTDNDLSELKDLAQLNEDYISDVYWAFFDE